MPSSCAPKAVRPRGSILNPRRDFHRTPNNLTIKLYRTPLLRKGAGDVFFWPIVLQKDFRPRSEEDFSRSRPNREF